MATYTVVNWRRLSPSVLDSVCVKGTLTLTHSRKSKTTLEFPEPRRVSEALAALKERHRGKPASNPKITGWIKLCEHVTVNGFKLGPLLGETISRHLNDAPSKDWIFLRSDSPYLNDTAPENKAQTNLESTPEKKAQTNPDSTPEKKAQTNPDSTPEKKAQTNPDST
jgi:hypothetical protein